MDLHINTHYSNAHSVWTDATHIITHHNAHCWISIECGQALRYIYYVFGMDCFNE